MWTDTTRAQYARVGLSEPRYCRTMRMTSRLQQGVARLSNETCAWDGLMARAGCSVPVLS